MLLAARCVVGVGEASFVALAAPFIGESRIHVQPDAAVALQSPCILHQPRSALTMLFVYGSSSCSCSPRHALCATDSRCTLVQPYAAMQTLSTLHRPNRAAAADDAAPKDAKGRWLAAFYLCVPTGYALGYIFGGLVAVPLSWRGPLIIEALLMLPLLGLCLLLPGKPTDIKLPPAGLP